MRVGALDAFVASRSFSSSLVSRSVSCVLGLFFVAFVSALQLAVTANALVLCSRERFFAGWVGAAVRLVLLVASVVAGTKIFFASLASRDAPPPAAPALVALVAAVLGPVVSFSVLWLAHRRRANAVYAEEERLARPFGAWLPVALFDAAFVALNVFLHVIAEPF